MEITVNRTTVPDHSIIRKGNVVVLKDDPEIIVLVTSNKGVSKTTFSGVTIADGFHGVGDYADNWCLNEFVQFTGEIKFKL